MPARTTYRIEGLTRWQGADAVADGLSALPGVRDVRMDIVAGAAVVTSDGVLPADQVSAAVTQAGYVLAAPRTDDRSAMRTVAVACGLVAALVAGFALARATDSRSDVSAVAGRPAPAAATHQHPSAGVNAAPGGLSISNAGYTVVPATTTFGGPGSHGLSFRITDARGVTVTRFAVLHEKPMHLILVRRDLSGYRHLHPVMAADGTWTVSAPLAEPGAWWAYADFTPAGATAGVTLGYGLLVGGVFHPRPLPAASQESTVNGYQVRYDGVPRIGATTPTRFRITRGGAAVTDLQRYLGSLGHLVVLRAGDLGYVHAHAEPTLSDGAPTFWLTAPGPGTYRLFFEFQVDGQVRTAEFTVALA